MFFQFAGSEWKGDSNFADWIYGEKYGEVYERALDTSSQCAEQC